MRSFFIERSKMHLTNRLRSALRAATRHLLISVIVAIATAFLIFGVWYPSPFDQLTNGRDLFILVIAVDVICGPLLTLVVFNPHKSRGELVRDIGFVVLLQLIALGYGISSASQARPVWIALEGDSYQVVSLPDIDLTKLDEAPAGLRHLSLTGPKLVGVRLASGSDPDYRASVLQTLDGNPPAYRPNRWVDYSTQVNKAIQLAHPLARLYAKHSDNAALIDATVSKSGVTKDKLGYLPLISPKSTEWTAVINLESGMPIGYLPLDAWE